MADTNKGINVSLSSLVPDSVDNAVKNMTDKPSKYLGELLDSLLFLATGGITHRATLRRMKYASEQEQFQKELKDKANAIPEEKRIEPNSQLILSALSDSQYCVEDKVLRTMFANLIASSMNIDYANYVHPSFSSIIKQMTALDARNLSLFQPNISHPIAQYVVKIKESQGTVTVDGLVFLSNPEMMDIQIQSTSIYSLAAFGLLDIDFINHLLKDGAYDEFFQTSRYIGLKSYADQHPIRSDGNIIEKVDVTKGIASLTGRGVQFLKVCLPTVPEVA